MSPARDKIVNHAKFLAVLQVQLLEMTAQDSAVVRHHAHGSLAVLL